MNRKTLNILMGLAFLLVLISLSLVPFGGLTQAAPPAAPTPVADYLTAGVQPIAVTFQATTAITADTNSSVVEVLRLGMVDVQYVIDHGDVNTTTLKVQYSNDNSNWVDGLTLVSASAADGTTITRVPVFGRYMRVNQDVATADTITITILAVGK